MVSVSNLIFFCGMICAAIGGLYTATIEQFKNLNNYNSVHLDAESNNTYPMVKSTTDSSLPIDNQYHIESSIFDSITNLFDFSTNLNTHQSDQIETDNQCFHSETDNPTHDVFELTTSNSGSAPQSSHSSQSATDSTEHAEL